MSLGRNSGKLQAPKPRHRHRARTRPDRVVILDAWIERAVTAPIRQSIQADGRIRRWARIPEMDHRYLRLILLPDGQTAHSAFFDRGFVP